MSVKKKRSYVSRALVFIYAAASMLLRDLNRGITLQTTVSNKAIVFKECSLLIL